MRPLLGVVLVAAMLPVSRAQQAGVHVQVVDIDSRLPIARVRLTATVNAALPPAFTDEHGEALLDPNDIGPTVLVSRAGYVSTTASLAPDADGMLTIPLARGAAISGRVTDVFGMPVTAVDVRVTPDARAAAAGRKDDARPAAHVTKTDDLGDYRVGGLAEGEYRVTFDDATHLVTLQRGYDAGGIDFAASTRNTCRPPATRREGPYGSATLRGRVLTLDNKPLACVQVVAFSSGTRVADAVTGSDGRYVLPNLRGGTYGLEFSRAGFVTLQLSQQRPGEPGRLILLRDREDVKNPDMVLPRSGAITGTLLDAAEDPVEGVQMRALQLRGQDERTLGVPAATAVTDDRGQYRLFGLPPGRYIVVAAPEQEPANGKTGIGYGPVYYAGSADIGEARELEVEPEREHPWADFVRVTTRVRTVTGSAVDSRNACVDPGRVLLVPSQRSGSIIAGTHTGQANGGMCEFRITNVPPGDYVVQAAPSISTRGVAPTAEFGMAYVTVNDIDPLPVSIKTRPGSKIVGRLIQEGSALEDPRAFALAAAPVDYDNTSVLAGVSPIAVGPRGELEVDGVNGIRRFTLTAAPPGWYLKSVRFGARNLTESTLDVRFGAPSGLLEVIVSRDGASVSGTASDGLSTQPDFSVLLFATDPKQWYENSRRVKVARSNGRGHFVLDGMPGGDYWIVALDPLEGTATGLWQNRAMLERLVPVAHNIQLREGAAQTVTLAVVHR